MTSPRPSHTELDPSWIEDVLKGNFKAVARMITLVENGTAEAVPYLQALFPHTGRCVSIGITGSPGSGKSTLVDRLAGQYRAERKRVGIIAVDPTSPFTGGAILGDRIRMQSRSVDPGTFIRSMATRGHLGGLAQSTADVLMVLDAAGFDVVLVETVGVGQDEIEIARTAETTMVLVIPGMGDDIQAMKAGIMEIGDIFVINKSDRPGADRVEAELNALLSLNSRADDWKSPVVRTVSTRGLGIEECVRAVRDHRTWLVNSSYRQERSIERQKERLIEVVRAHVLRQLLSNHASAQLVDVLARRIVERKMDPFSAAEQLLQAAAKSHLGSEE